MFLTEVHTSFEMCKKETDVFEGKKRKEKLKCFLLKCHKDM